MSADGVRAVVVAGAGDDAARDRQDLVPASLAALERQTTRPAGLLVARRLRGGTTAPGVAPPDDGAAWVWLIDSGVAPEPTALERLLEAVERISPLARPVLMAGKVVTPEGRPDPGSLPIPSVSDPELAVTAFDRHLLALRAARSGSLLVDRRAFDRLGPPRAGGLEWSGRLLRDRAGFLEPASVAVRHPMDPRAERERRRVGLVDWVRLLAGSALDPRERPWFAFRLGEEAIGALRNRA